MFNLKAAEQQVLVFLNFSESPNDINVVLFLPPSLASPFSLSSVIVMLCSFRRDCLQPSASDFLTLAKFVVCTNLNSILKTGMKFALPLEEDGHQLFFLATEFEDWQSSIGIFLQTMLDKTWSLVRAVIYIISTNPFCHIDFLVVKVGNS